MKYALGGAVVLCGLLLWSGSVSAHHALQAQFDTEKSLTLKGNLARMEWINPAYFWFNVTDERTRRNSGAPRRSGPPHDRRGSFAVPHR